MRFDLTKYNGSCDCGKTHLISTKMIVIESGVTNELGEIIKSLRLKPVGCIICDSNTKPMADKVAEQIKSQLYIHRPIIMLEAENLEADEKSVTEMEAALSPYTSWLIAIGAGTIHDITRYVANKLKIPFISYPTAASGDAFASIVCAINWHGYPKTFQSVAPIAVIADMDVIMDAPYRLTAAGIGDALSKYTSLADWKCGTLLLNEDFCEKVYTITKNAVDDVFENLPAIHAREPYALELLMFALIISGIEMQMWGDSRPLSGIEHHISNFWDMHISNGKTNALLGEKLGVAMLLAIRYYEKISLLHSLDRRIKLYEGMPTQLLRGKFGILYDSILKENQPDPLKSIGIEKISGSFAELKQIIAAIPSVRKIRPYMQAAGCVTTLEEIGLERDVLPDTITYAPFVRKRLTILRTSKLLPM